MKENELRTASAADIPALRRNWKLCFGDTDDYLDFFFGRRFLPGNTLVLTEDGEAVSQLFLLPAAIRDTAGEVHPAYYLFAAATHPQYRGRGHMARLLRFARELSAQRGVNGIALQPGEKGLYDYYARFGYGAAFARRVWEGDLRMLPDLSAPNESKMDAIGFLLLFQQKRPGLCWDRPSLAFALDEHRRFRGRYAAADTAFASVEEDGVCRILSGPNDLNDGIALLRSITEDTQVRLILPPDAPLGDVEEGGMFLALEPIELDGAFLAFAKE